MGQFYIDTSTGRVATIHQLVEAGVTDRVSAPPRPWHPVQGTRDASTMWYAVMRKEVRDGVYIGSLCLRHTGHHASLLQQGWQEVPVAEIQPPVSPPSG
jgi:hypothetical protein